MLLMKLVLAPALVVGATLVGRRWGWRAGGIVIALPLVAGPILLILTLEHGETFGAHAARGALLGMVALSAFCVVFAHSQRLGWAAALVLGWLAYGLIAAAGSRWDAPPLSGLVVALTALSIARVLLVVDDDSRGAPGSPPPRWDIYARGVSTAVLVFTITTAADTLGPAVSGVLTPFPVATSVLAAFALAREGPAASASVLRGFVSALPVFAGLLFAAALALA